MPTPLDPSAKQDRMVQDQIVARGIRDMRVIEAMKWVPRERFFPQDIVSHAYDDAAAPIGHGQTISQPYIVALMSETLRVQPHHKVLEIGTGSGYQAAVLAKLAQEVYTVDRIKPLLDEAFERLSELHIRNVHFRFGDGSIGWREHAPFDRIIVTAAAPQLPQMLLDQLADGGICVAPVGERSSQDLVACTRRGNDFEIHRFCGVRFVPLLGEGGWHA